LPADPVGIERLHDPARRRGSDAAHHQGLGQLLALPLFQRRRRKTFCRARPLETDRPFPRAELLKANRVGQRLQELFLFEFHDARPQTAFESGDIVIAGQADMFPGQFLQAKLTALAAVEPFVQKPVEPFGGGVLKSAVELEIQALEVAGPETVEQDLVPNKS
jgi:hypothetical protein